MLKYFGPSSLFYIATPCDETSFRIRLYTFDGSSYELPLIDWTNEKCITDLNFRKKIHVMYLGAFAIELIISHSC